MSQADATPLTFNPSDSAFRTLFAHSADAMLLLYSGRFTDCNPAATRLMKCTREQLLSASPDQLSPELQPDGQRSSEKAAEMIRIAFERGSALFEWVHCRPNGEQFFVEVSLTSVLLEGRQLLFTVWRDITDRKKAEAGLRESEERYRMLFDSQQDGVFVAQDGNFQLVNSRFAEMTGFTVAELHGAPFSLVVAPEDLARVAENYRRRVAGEQLPEEYVINLLQKGSEVRIPVNLRAIVINFRGRSATMGSLHNISEKVLLEQELREREERYRSLFDSHQDGVFVIQDGIVQLVNNTLTRLTNYQASELEGLPFTQVIAPEDKAMVVDNYRKRLAGEPAPEEYGFDILQKDGVTRIPVNLRATVIQYRGRPATLGTLRNLSETLRMQSEIRDREEQNRLLLDNQQDGVFILQDDRVQVANQPLAAMIGCSLIEVHQMMLDRLVAPEDLPMVSGYYLDRVAGKPAPAEYILHLLHKDGVTRVPVNLRAAMINYRGRPAALGTASNLTERLKMEAELRESEQRFRNMVEKAPVAMHFYQLDAAARLIFVGANPAADAVLKVVHTAKFGKPIEEAFPDLAGTEVPAIYHRLAAEDGSWHTEQVTSDESGIRSAYALMAFHTSPGNMMVTINDITERMRFEKQLQEMFARRGAQTQVSTEISQEIASSPSVSDLFERVVTLVKERLGYYHTQILRYEPGLNAVVLVKGYGETGAKMLAAGHRMEMGRGLIGLAAASGQTILRPAVANDPNWCSNPLLPETRGEIAVPIKYGSRILGVLDVQSDRAGRLSDDDRLLLEGLCGQIAISLESTSLRQEMQERLNELNRLYQETAREGWASFRASDNMPAGYLYDRVDIRPAEDIWFEEIGKAAAQKNMVLPESAAGAAVAPLSVRGEVIGTLGVYNDMHYRLTEEELELIEQVSEQVALALESARLFEQTSSALDETEKLYNFSRRLAEAPDLDAIVSAVVEAAGIPEVNRGVLITFDYDDSGDLVDGIIKAAWYSGEGAPLDQPVGAHYPRQFVEGMLKRFQVLEPVFFNETGPESRQRGIFSLAVLPLYVGSDQIGAILLETSVPHGFTEDEKRPMHSLAQQAAITIQSRLLLEQIIASEAALRTSEANLSAAQQIARIGSWQLDLTTLDFWLSRDHLVMMGLQPTDNKGMTLSLREFTRKYVAPEDYAVSREQLQLARKNAADPNYHGTFEYRLLTVDGRQLNMMSTVRKKAGDLNMLVGTTQDITERKQAQETIAKRAVELATVAEIATRVSTIQVPDEMLQTVVDLTKQVFGLYHVHIYLLNETSENLVISKGAGEVGRRIVAEGRQIATDAEKSLVARAARTRQGVIVNNVSNDPDFLAHPLLPDTRSEMAVPMIAGDRLLGVIDIQDNQVGRFTPEDVNIMTTLAAQVSISLQNARSFARAQREAEREALINAISERIQGTTSIENALQVAVREIGRALGAQRTAIRLGLESTPGLERKSDGE